MWERRNQPLQRCLHRVGPQGTRASSKWPPPTPVQPSVLEHCVAADPGQGRPQGNAVSFLPVAMC